MDNYSRWVTAAIFCMAIIWGGISFYFEVSHNQKALLKNQAQIIENQNTYRDWFNEDRGKITKLEVRMDSLTAYVGRLHGVEFE